MKPYRKAIFAALVALTSALAAALTDDAVTSGEAVGLILAVLTAVGVYVVPNEPA